MDSYTVGVIGYRNHSKKILSIFLKNSKHRFKIFVHKKKSLKNFIQNSRVKYSNTLKDFLDLKIIIIASPSRTHLKYLSFFKSKDRYIFCEKPGVTTLKELSVLNNFKNSEKDKIYFNFNYIHSELFENLKKLLLNKKYSNLVNVAVNCSHGLYFKNKKIPGRFNNNNIYENIFGNLSIHYIHMFIELFKNVSLKYINIISTNKDNLIDTVVINLIINKKINVSLFLSYASIYNQSMEFYFNNAKIEFIDGKLVEHFPRDNFNKQGKFAPPNKKILNKYVDLTNDSLEKSVNFFLKTVSKKEKFNKYYQNAISTNELILNYKKVLKN